jgi:DNA-binding MarR family transcriptional regulator
MLRDKSHNKRGSGGRARPSGLRATRSVEAENYRINLLTREKRSRIINVKSQQKDREMPRPRRSPAGDSPWLSPSQLRAWVAYMRVQLRMNYEINRQLQRDCGLSLSDYHVLNALSNSPDHKLQVSDLAALIGWERSRLSHHLRRLSDRGLTKRIQSTDDGRATDAVLTKKGLDAMVEAAPGHALLVKKLFFEPLPDELVAPFTAALEHIQASLNLNASLPPVPL